MKLNIFTSIAICSFIVLLFISEVKSDLPVHCLKKQVKIFIN